MSRDAANVDPAGAVLDEHQDIEPFKQHCVDMQEIYCKNPGGLSREELPPGRASAARRRIDARGMQDLPDGGRRDAHAELGQLAVDPAISPQRVLLGQANGKAGDAADCRRPARLAAPARVVLPAGQFAVPGQQGRWCHGKDRGPAAARYQPRQRGEPGPIWGLVPHPPGVTAQYRVLVPEDQQLGILRLVPAERHDGQG